MLLSKPQSSILRWGTRISLSWAWIEFSDRRNFKNCVLWENHRCLQCVLIAFTFTLQYINPPNISSFQLPVLFFFFFEECRVWVSGANMSMGVCLPGSTGKRLPCLRQPLTAHNSSASSRTFWTNPPLMLTCWLALPEGILGIKLDTTPQMPAT